MSIIHIGTLYKSDQYYLSNQIIFSMVIMDFFSNSINYDSIRIAYTFYCD